MIQEATGATQARDNGKGGQKHPKLLKTTYGA